MRIRTVKYIISEGVSNTHKNKLMSLASVSTVTASILIFGIFMLIVFNLNFNISVLKQQPEMQAFCEFELDGVQVEQIEQTIKENKKIEEYKIITQEEAFEKFKEDLGDGASVLEGFDENLLSVSFIIKVKAAENSEDVVSEIKEINGIRKVAYSKDVINFISKLTYWINAISIFLITILLVVSVFIIANTIKLTVFARRKEIGIMKFIGAADWFIRWPFVLEGIIIGVIAAGIALALTLYGYNIIENRFNSDMSVIGGDLIQLVTMGDVRFKIALFYCLLGSIVGAAGSLISIRKYLRV